MAKKLVKASKDASWARLFPLNKITVLQAQFFDNWRAATGVKGQSEFAVKIFAYHRGNKIGLAKDADWYRIVQLIDPKRVQSWAKQKHDLGDMTGEEFACYDAACENAIHRAKDTDTYELVRMGHIASPPGKQYFVGQFVYFEKTKAMETADSAIRMIVFNDGDTLDLDCWGPTRKKGKIRKPGTPTHYTLHDPCDIVGRERREAEIVEARSQDHQAIQEPHIQDQYREFLRGSPF